MSIAGFFVYAGQLATTADAVSRLTPSAGTAARGARRECEQSTARETALGESACGRGERAQRVETLRRRSGPAGVKKSLGGSLELRRQEYGPHVGPPTDLRPPLLDLLGAVCGEERFVPPQLQLFTHHLLVTRLRPDGIPRVVDIRHRFAKSPLSARLRSWSPRSLSMHQSRWRRTARSG